LISLWLTTTVAQVQLGCSIILLVIVSVAYLRPPARGAAGRPGGSCLTCPGPGVMEAGSADLIDEHLMEDVINGAAPMDGAAPPRVPPDPRIAWRNPRSIRS
jgi:hypothetical protein